MRDITHLIKNWQACDGSYPVDGTIEVPDGWGIRYVDGTAIPEAGDLPPVIGVKPEVNVIPVDLLPGQYDSKFAKSPPNPQGYSHVVKAHKWSAPFRVEFPQDVSGLTAGKRYMARGFFFPDLYKDDGSAPGDPYSGAAGFSINGQTELKWLLTFDQWNVVEVEFEAESDTVEIAPVVLSKWGLAGNTFWIHGFRLFELEGETPVEPEPFPVEAYDKHYNVVEATVPVERRKEIYSLIAERQQTVGPAATDAVSWAKELLDFGKTVKVSVWDIPSDEHQRWLDWMHAIDPRIEVVFEGVSPPSSGGNLVDIRDQLVTNPASPWFPWRRRALSDITTVFVHHSAGALSSDVQTVKNIAIYHTSPTGKNRPGICYTYVIGADGTTWYVSDIENVVFSQGSITHPGDENLFGVGVCLLGNFTAGREPTEKQMSSLETLIAYLNGLTGRTLRVWGHKDVDGTQCPGDSWPWMPGWGKVVSLPKKAVHGAPVYTPPDSPDSQVQRAKDLGVKWFKLLTIGDPKMLEFALKLKAAGIEPVVRIYNQNRKGRNPNLHAAYAYINSGITLIEPCNEPNIEWENISWRNPSDVSKVADEWFLDARDIIAAGGRAAFPAMAPTDRGGVNQTVSGVMWASLILQHVSKQAEFRDWVANDKLWLAVHVSPFNKPFAKSPMDTWGVDDFCLRYYEIPQAWFMSAFGKVPLTISTEGGVYSPSHMRDLTFPSDGNNVFDEQGNVLYSWNTWKSYTDAMYKWLEANMGIPVCTWTFTDEGVVDPQWLGCGWYDAQGALRLR